MTQANEAAFLNAACVPLDSDHRSGDLAEAGRILAANPEVASASIYTAAVLADDLTATRFWSPIPRSQR